MTQTANYFLVVFTCAFISAHSTRRSVGNFQNDSISFALSFSTTVFIVKKNVHESILCIHNDPAQTCNFEVVTVGVLSLFSSC